MDKVVIEQDHQTWFGKNADGLWSQKAEGSLTSHRRVGARYHEHG